MLASNGLERVGAERTFSPRDERVSLRRVRRRCCHRPLPSELLVRVPPQAAQAFQMPSSGHGSTSVSP